MADWKKEWSKFSQDAIENMKKYSDKTYDEREWMTYVYDVGNKYELGEVTYGGLSRIEVSPQKKAIQDKIQNGFTEKQRKWTIHGHPLKDGKIYTGRQYFSSTDICREFIKSRDGDERVVQFLVYPHKQENSTSGKEVIHNRVRVLVFPNREILTKAMKMSNPHVNAMGISVESGQNHQVKKPDGSMSLENKSKVNWFSFQEALGKLGYMGIVDIEGPKQGSVVYMSEGKRMASNLGGFALIGIIAMSLLKLNKSKKTDGVKAESVEVIDDLAHYMKY
jgi:hypothetical protein